MELKNIRKIHFTGIKGVAMTSLALCAKDLGIKITGTDKKEVFVTDEILKIRKIKWQVGIRRRKWQYKPDLLITTGAHGGLNNNEVVSARNAGIKVISQAEALNIFSRGKDLISVCGVGGKTTITSMIATIFDLNYSPVSYVIGVGRIKPIGFGGQYKKKSKVFICEADEYAISPGFDNRPKFSVLSPKVVVVTNIEHDHPDIYRTIRDTQKAFLSFFEKIPGSGLLVYLRDNKNTRSLVKKVRNTNIVSFGFDAKSDWKITGLKIKNGFQEVEFTDPKGEKYSLSLKIPGSYNALDALASFIVADYYGFKSKDIVQALNKFGGTQRRIEKVGTSKSGLLVYDDYAHHPEEIKAVLKTFKEFFPEKRIITVFQPHTYSRTKVLFEGFSKAFLKSDVVLILDIYASAREKRDKSVNSKKLSKSVSKHQKSVFYVKDFKGTLDWLKRNHKDGDLVVTMGAGNVFYLDKEILKI